MTNYVTFGMPDLKVILTMLAQAATRWHWSKGVGVVVSEGDFMKKYLGLIFY